MSLRAGVRAPRATRRAVTETSVVGVATLRVAILRQWMEILCISRAVFWAREACGQMWERRTMSS
eukprot:654086-Pyramimonas_sp.AAC.1